MLLVIMFYPPSQLPENRSIPAATVIPVLPYPDVRAAVAWLTDTFGFVERLQISDHRSQMVAGDGAVIVAEYIDRDQRPVADARYASHLVMVRVPNVQAHYAHVLSKGVEICHEPEDYFYGERQYTVRDLGGHLWTFSETLFDADPGEWGGPDVVLKA